MEGSSIGSGILPAIFFLVALGLAFATGTSWGTFGILIPIVVAIFKGVDSEMCIRDSCYISQKKYFIFANNG